MREAIDARQHDFYLYFSADQAKIKQYTYQFMLDKIDNSPEYHYLFIEEYLIADHYQPMIPQLINRLTNATKVGLENSFDLIIDERIKSGELESWGHGGVVEDDLFTIAGRANFLLRRITDEDFGHVSMYSSANELRRLQQKWANWYLKQSIEE
ncbi:hypothetical protein GCM10023186_27010 [Hymenobacter koreensis]|uniref:Uncharacterized protein n=2 Tax=Hymenobacter koreensis TaxID=1084523 RepID=A0ABP8J4I5_9BACT